MAAKPALLKREPPLPTKKLSFAAITPQKPKTLTRADLASAVVDQTGISRSESARLIDTVLEEISEAFVRGEKVKLSGFGTFNVRSKAERIGRNPKTGEEFEVTARTVLTFTPSTFLRGIMAQER